MRKKIKNILVLTCLFATSVFSASYIDAGLTYLSPPPNAVEVSRYATIFMRFRDFSPQHISNLSSALQVSNESGTKLSGQLKIASDEKTVIFTPNAPFIAGETIYVTIAPVVNGGEKLSVLDYSFQVSAWESADIPRDELVTASLKKSTKTTNTPRITSTGVSVPGDFPLVDVSVNTTPGPGYIFLNNWGGYPYTMILDNSGAPIWYVRGVNDGDRRRDFKVQDNGLLTMRVLGNAGYEFGDGFIGLDATYSFVRGFHASSGYHTDEHELQVLENGNYLLVALRSVKMDMSRYVAGGNKNATIHETGIQEFTPEGELIFHWRALDNFDIPDMFGHTDENPTGSSFRFPHMNSIDIDDDGHIILSSKRLSEVTKIHRQTGEFIWRLGGANNEFEFINDPLQGFSLQHSARALGSGRYTIFDNGVLHEPQLSRALEYEIDTDNWTATLVWSFQREKPNDYAFHMGNVQRLENGNTMINWAVQNMPKAQEVTPAGETVYEMNFQRDAKTYRAFRFPWDGVAKTPVLFVEQQIDHVALIFNKFGDDTIDYYNIYMDDRPRPTTVVATSTETLYRLSEFENGKRYFFRVTAVDADGVESVFSNEEYLVVSIVSPGEEMVGNGDFSSGKNNWDWLVRGGAQASWTVADGAARISIANGGGDDHDIQLTQSGIMLIQGRDYVFEFDAWADAPRTIEAKIAQNGGSFTNYSRTGITALSRSQKRHSYRFKMNEATDNDARIVFNVGASTTDVHVTNVSVKMLGESDVKENAPASPLTFQLLGNYPNPFNAQTTVQFSLREKSDISLSIFNILGERVRDQSFGIFDHGEHRIQLSSEHLPSGVYLYRLVARNNAGVVSYSHVAKMTLLR